jgi:hypothetical protein
LLLSFARSLTGEEQDAESVASRAAVGANNEDDEDRVAVIVAHEGANGVVGSGSGAGCSTSGRPTGANSGSASGRNDAASDQDDGPTCLGTGRCTGFGKNA